MTLSASTLPEARGGRPLVMGVVNVTPDSFSDGGAWFTPQDAVAHGRDLVVAGADLLDPVHGAHPPRGDGLDHTELSREQPTRSEREPA